MYVGYAYMIFIERADLIYVLFTVFNKKNRIITRKYVTVLLHISNNA